MFDLDEIMKNAERASKQASAAMEEMFKRSEAIAKQAASHEEPGEEERLAQEQRAAQQQEANQQRQVEILGQLLGPQGAAQAAATEAQIQAEVERQVAGYAALSMEGMMGKLFGEDMGVISAALETLAMEEDDEDEEDREFDLALEQELYQVLEDKLAQIDALPEPEPSPYAKGDPRWERFGILLSGIISNLNSHELDSMDVEEHIPVMEQQIVSLVRRSWGINGRGELLETIRYLTQEGYVLRYQAYCMAKSPEELFGEEADEEEQESVGRAWRFVQRYKGERLPDFLLGWDVGRAAMLARWGCYLGWITAGEATGILWDLSQKAAKGLRSWREFAQSYLFGGLLWKLLCGDADAESYLGYLADAAVDLLTGSADEDEGQWRECPWPETRRIGFL